MRGPVERGNIRFSPIDERGFARTDFVDDLLLARQLARQRLVNFALSFGISVIKKSIVAVPIVIPAGVIEDRV